MQLKHSFPFIFCILIFGLNSSKGQNIKLTKIWETDSIFLAPESVAFDSIRNSLYVSNYSIRSGFRQKDDTLFRECISKMDLVGNLITLRWIDSLIGPTGIAIYNDKLFAVERGFLTKIDIQNSKIENRYPIKDFGFPNDIVIDSYGTIYITDSEKNCIYKFNGKEVQIWLTDSLFGGLNGLYIDEDRLIVGNSTENSLLSVSLNDKKVNVIAKNAIKFVDGISVFNNEFIVSGATKIISITKNGSTYELLESNNQKIWYADFEIIYSKKILVVPALFSKKVIAFEID